MSFAALILAAATAPGAPPPAGDSVASAQVSVTIVKPAIVRQANGVEQVPGAPVPQMTRRPGAVLAEFQ